MHVIEVVGRGVLDKHQEETWKTKRDLKEKFGREEAINIIKN